VLDARELIRQKRDGGSHRPDALRAFVAAYARGEIPDYQMSAWLMAAFLEGLDDAETEALTRALLESGRRFDWSGLGRPSADKHSTGGVGDKISLALAPLVAACGVLVPMVSGRGLGHTGGTLDKLESIPGFRTRLTPEEMRAQLDRVGVVMVGQGPDLAPADGKLYALRDVTATVEYEPFIVSSIVSKKIAEGASAVVYDVKCGNGAFMRTAEAARSLARRLVTATRGLGARAAALITDMSQPLGEAAGNALEVRETVEVLHGRGPGDVRELTLELAARMLELAGAARDRAAARDQAMRALESGAAWEKFVAMVEAQGGDPATLERADGLPRAPVLADVPAPRAGAVAAIDTFGLGELVVAIGGGRRAKEDAIDPRVGLEVRKRIGDRVERGEPLVRLHLAAEDPSAVARAAACFTIADRAPQSPALVLERVD
jgi:pyrimidine-nucleoside phosphorylase/thymidine phosphorylase